MPAITARTSEMTPVERLPDAEYRVFLLATCGLQAKEIAQRLGRSVHTVRHQIEDARRRLGVQTSSDLRALALARGWVCAAEVDRYVTARARAGAAGNEEL